MLTVHIPETCRGEIEYVLGVVFTEWLGVPFRVEAGAHEGIEIEREGGVLSLDASFFRAAAGAWLEDASMPVLPTGTLELADVPVEIVRRLRERVPEQPGEIPVLYGEPRVVIPGAGDEGAEQGGRRVRCDVDIFGSIFFMLSRYEEVVVPDRDEHDRFPAATSVAFKAGFLERPIVNEYVELLWAMMGYLWPWLERRKREFRILVSHDVDVPFEDAFRPPYWALRRAASDVLKRRDPVAALEQLRRWKRIRSGNLAEDRNNTFDFIMSQSEKRGLTSAFYFIPKGSSDQTIRYDVNDPIIQGLLKRIDERGHEIGYHASYETYQDEDKAIREVEYLRRALEKAHIQQEVKGGRQHYLRWRTPYTFRNWEAAGLAYDTTLGFADHAGFRCGTCWELPVYDVVHRSRRNLVERPLIAMECSITSERYMGLGYYEAAYKRFVMLKDQCRVYAGDFSLLWHNNELISDEQRRLYVSILDS